MATALYLKKNEERRIKNGHPWVFSNEIARIDGEREIGCSAELYDAGGAFMGVGHYNPYSLIAFRLLCKRAEDTDSVQWFANRIEKAVSLRKQYYPGLSTYRAVYGESDALPGLVVDKYGDYLSIQILSAGMENRRELIVDALRQQFHPLGIIARNDVSVRKLEGLCENVEVLAGNIPETVEMMENGLKFNVNLATGQKTGGFLDQKDNHRLLEPISANKNILDCFCYNGSWGIHGAKYSAKSVLGLDISKVAISQAAENSRLNGFSHLVRFEECDVFEKLRILQHEHEKFGVIVMDPPAFVKSRKTIAEGLKGYLTVNRRAMELLEPEGYLVTCSCSYHISREAFRDMLVQAARLAKREMRLVETRSQASDHPVLLSFPESEYLKCYVLQAL